MFEMSKEGGMEGDLILVADDSPTLVRIVSEVLSNEGYRVLTAADGVETVQQFYAHRPDLLITDIAMPKLSGYLVCRLIKEDWSASHVPILMLTARDSATDRYWATKSGAERYLTKDFGPDDLLAVVAELIRDRQPSTLSPVSAPQHLSEGSVLTRVCEMLDRKLFETTLVNEIGELASNLSDFAEAADAALSVLSNFLEYTIGALALADERILAIRPVGDVSRANVAGVVEQMDEAMGNLPNVAHTEGDAAVVTFESVGRVVEEETDRLQTFVSMPLRSGGNIIGLLGLASTKANAFGETELATVRIIEHPLAGLVNTARLYERIATATT
ncbi:MAG: response regulator [Actinobacteria bacterium ATB1]|nr:response regulator [Actinobacteria bacterium ATB1]